MPVTTTTMNMVQLNRAQNPVPISTLGIGPAEAYGKLSEIPLDGKHYKVSPYVTAPDNPAKGIPCGIPK